jgi:4-amino-4-deoxy-L-arabinose transferase-like glycosyltransferase
VWTLKWQEQPVLNRPPAAVWPLALATRLFGAREWAVRGVVAIEAALVVAFVFLLGARRYSIAVGLVGALLVATADRFFVYARYVESEPLLVLACLVAILCWEKSREDPRWTYGWAAGLGVALLTKQIVGALPLMMPIVERRRPPWPALALALAIALPWHVVMAVRYGGAFFDAFFLRNVGRRTVVGLHGATTTPFFYVHMLWQKEGPLVLLALLGLAWAAWRRDRLLMVWTLGVLIPFSIAASRFDYYTLIAYPALALLGARLLCEAAPRLRVPLAVAGVALSAVVHVVPRLGQPLGGDYDMRRLGHRVARVARPDDVLLVIAEWPFTPRYYSGHHTVEVVVDPARYDEATYLLPGEVVLAPDLVRVTARHSRWFAIAPKALGQKLASLGMLYLVDQGATYFLFTNQPGQN